MKNHFIKQLPYIGRVCCVGLLLISFSVDIVYATTASCMPDPCRSDVQRLRFACRQIDRMNADLRQARTRLLTIPRSRRHLISRIDREIRAYQQAKLSYEQETNPTTKAIKRRIMDARARDVSQTAREMKAGLSTGKVLLINSAISIMHNAYEQEPVLRKSKQDRRDELAACRAANP